MARKNFIRLLISSPIVQTFLIYISGGWIALEMTDYFIRRYTLDERISDVLSIILLIGLPVAIFLAWYLSREVEEHVKKASESAVDKKSHGLLTYLKKNPWFSIPGSLVLILLVLVGIRFIHLQIRIHWAREKAIPQMQELLDDLDLVNAFPLSQRVKKFIPENAELVRMDSVITRRFTILTDPAGAEVYYKEYPYVEREWILLGTTPLTGIELPNMTMYRWKFEKQGYEVVNAAASTYQDTLFRTMHKTGEIPLGMVFVEGLGRETESDFDNGEKHGFFIDRLEVTNKQYKEFIDQGGYQDPAFWQNEFILDNETLSFAEAMDQFKDATGRPGPSSWDAGDYPDGQEDYPVSGISWYEAAAYAVYTGKSLPADLHWRSAAGLESQRYRFFHGSHVVPFSNMRGISPEPVGENPGINCFGTYDMSGNIREWCWNVSPAGRVIRGGAWDDIGYMSIYMSQLPPIDRSPKNGFRCALYPDREKIPEEVFLPVEIEIQRDYRSEEPVSEAEFQILKKQFLYDNKDLNSRVEERDEMPADWILEKVSFDAAYGQERMIAYIFLPKEALPPFQTIIYFGGAWSLQINSIFGNRVISRNIFYNIKNGRAVILPIYKGTFERRDGTCDPRPPCQSHQYTECLVRWVKDLSRTIDYLETRKDIDTNRLAYIGDSWGGRMGAIILAVEDRIRLGVWTRCGLHQIHKFPESDEINYITHVNTPVLMINGQYDFTCPYESTVKPMFDLLGTPEQDKKLVLCNTDHYIPRTVLIKEVLDWLDQYFGPVNK